MEEKDFKSIQGSSNLDAMQYAPFYQRAMQMLLIEKLKLLKNRPDRVIDFGAGNLDYAKGVSQLTGVSVDCFEPFVAAPSNVPSGLSVYSSLAQLPTQAPVAYSLNVLEHIEDDVSALSSWREQLKIGGLLFLLVPAHEELWTNMDTKVGHLRRYTADSLRICATKAKFDVIEEGWFDHTGYIATMALKLKERLRAKPSNWTGELNKNEVMIFDFLFKWIEPALRPLMSHTFMAKNRWVLLRRIV